LFSDDFTFLNLKYITGSGGSTKNLKPLSAVTPELQDHWNLEVFEGVEPKIL